MVSGVDVRQGKQWRTRCRLVEFDGGLNGGAFLHCIRLGMCFSAFEREARMKLFTICLVVALSTTTFAQRENGNTRPDADRGGSGGGGRPPRTAPPAADSTPPQPAPQQSSGGGTVVVCCPSLPPIIIFEPPVILEDEPEFLEITLIDREGFDFSAEEILDAGSKQIDVTFSGDGAEFYVGNDADIQDLGNVSFERLESPPSNWSMTRKVKAEPGNVYVVWTWDNQFYKFQVASLGEKRVVIEWAQLDGGRKRAVRDDRRNGNVRYTEKEVTFGR